MYDIRPNLIIGFHGCDADVRDNLINNPDFFTEGGPAFDGSGLSAKSHVQICIRNPNCIKGFFLPRRESTFPLTPPSHHTPPPSPINGYNSVQNQHVPDASDKYPALPGH
jgi:hypothetical protein